MPNKKIRTRFAPSPTGYLHVGGLRTALYSYLFAKQNKGDFIIRIEDTDRSREVAGAVDNLLKSLKWAGLEADEGIIIGSDEKPTEIGDFGSYFQSKRTDIYKKYAKKLIKEGSAYYCFCSSERLSKLRQDQQKSGQPTKYDGRCRKLTLTESQEKLNNGEKAVVRMKIPSGREIIFQDRVRSNVKFDSDDLDDQVLIKSDGYPTYHLANVVDDHLMKITDVIRGEEWLPSAPKHILLYEMFGWQPPKFAHLPLLLNTDKSKLSKRQGDVSVDDYRKKGYLPEALINFVALLGWNPGTDKELFSIDELIDEFDLNKIHKAGAVFNLEKLDWINGQYIKKMNIDRMKKSVKELTGKEFDNKILKLEQSRVSKLTEVGDELDYLTDCELKYNPDDLVWKKSDKEKTIFALTELIGLAVKIPEGKWTATNLQAEIMKLIEDKKINNGDMLWPMRYALSGKPKSPPPFDLADILGKNKTIKRLNLALDKLK